MSTKKRRHSAVDAVTTFDSSMISPSVCSNNRAREERKLKTRMLIRNLILHDTGHSVPLDKINSTKPKIGPFRIHVADNDRSYPNTSTSRITPVEFARLEKFFKVRVSAEWVGNEDEYLAEEESEEGGEEEDYDADISAMTTGKGPRRSIRLKEPSDVSEIDDKDAMHPSLEVQMLREQLAQAYAKIGELEAKAPALNNEVIRDLLRTSSLLRTRNEKLEEALRTFRTAGASLNKYKDLF